MSVKGLIHSVETCGTTDGPGIRYILFMQGCQMRCLYCHNRDTWSMKSGYELSVKEVMNDVRRYRRFFRSSGGGLTISGGEAALQPKFVAALYKACRKEGINTCLDTNGFVKKYNDDVIEMVENVDMVLLDIKQMNNEKHLKLTKVSNAYTLKFAKYLAKIDKPAWIRYVVLPGYTDAKEDIIALGKFLEPMKNIKKVELLPFHQMGAHKWAVFNDDYKLKDTKPPTRKRLDKIVARLEDYGLNVAY